MENKIGGYLDLNESFLGFGSSKKKKNKKLLDELKKELVEVNEKTDDIVKKIGGFIDLNESFIQTFGSVIKQKIDERKLVSSYKQFVGKSFLISKNKHLKNTEPLLIKVSSYNTKYGAFLVTLPELDPDNEHVFSPEMLFEFLETGKEIK